MGQSGFGKTRKKTEKILLRVKCRGSVELRGAIFYGWGSWEGSRSSQKKIYVELKV